jgi:hypothetical protein
MAIFPVNVDGIRYATAQLVAKRDGKIYMMQIAGIPTTICMQDGKTMKSLKPRGMAKPVYKNFYLLTREQAEHLFLEAPDIPESLEFPESPSTSSDVAFTKVKEAGSPRQIPIGVQKVAEEPVDGDFDHAAVYKIELPAERDGLLEICYQGDVARLYADGRLVADNFYYGRPFLYGLWRLSKDVTELQLRILPFQPDAPIYLPREANRTAGESVKSIKIINR